MNNSIVNYNLLIPVDKGLVWILQDWLSGSVHGKTNLGDEICVIDSLKVMYYSLVNEFSQNIQNSISSLTDIYSLKAILKNENI